MFRVAGYTEQATVLLVAAYMIINVSGERNALILRVEE
jgi:hypothetical protein